MKYAYFIHQKQNAYKGQHFLLSHLYLLCNSKQIHFWFHFILGVFNYTYI